MKILIIHNAYRQRGGEDIVAQAEIALLRDHGHEVEIYQRDNHELRDASRLSAAMSAIWSRKTGVEIAALCAAFQPAVIHAHNTFPLISPALYWAASRSGIPLIQTLHNFRLLCPQAMFLRENKPCEDCLGKLPWRAIAHKCYRDSAAQSAVAAAMLATHRALGTYRTKIAGYIALSNFSREKFIAGGLPAQRIHIKPNFVKSDRMPDWHARNGALFVGRLSAEKGLALLMQAMISLPAATGRGDTSGPLKIVGAGPLAPELRRTFGAACLGFRGPAEVAELQRASLFQVAPSTCYETFGLVAVEAFSRGLPVIAGAHGGLGELIEDGVTGLLFRPGDAADLAAKLAWAYAHPDDMLRMGRAAYAEYLRKYTPEKNYRTLIEIYQHAMSATQGADHVTQRPIGIGRAHQYAVVGRSDRADTDLGRGA